MKVCSKCNDTYPDDANFCLVDGTSLTLSAVTGKQCPKCQRTYPLEAGFCMIEGAPLVELRDVVEAPTTNDDDNAESKKSKPARTRTRKTKSNPSTKKRKDTAPDQKAIFTRGLTKWFQRMNFGVGLSPQNVDTEKDLKLAEKVAGVASTLLDFGSSMWITGGQGSDALFQALIPYVPLCDLVGSNLKLNTVNLVPVIYADELPADQIEQKFDQFIEMAGPLTEFGPRLNFQSQGVANIFPLVVYFDHQTFEKHLPELLPDAWQKRIMRRIYLQASLVSVPERRVVMGERTGFFALGDKLADVLGTRTKVFDSSDIDAVLLLANEEDL
jgi:hypothetical protein